MANTDRLDIIPAQLRVIVTVRPKYACRVCTDGVAQAPSPAHLPEDDAEFLAAYLAAEAATGKATPATTVAPVVTPGSLEDVARGYLGSAPFRNLSEAYRQVRRNDIRRLLNDKDGQMAHVPFAKIEEEHVRRNVHAPGGNPGRERRKTWSALATHAFNMALTSTNVVERVRGPAAAETEGHVPWSLDQVARFRERWPYGTEERVLFEVLCWCGSRIGDTVALGPEHLDDGFLTFRPSKTGGEVWVPYERELPAFAVAEDLEHLERAIAAMGRGTGTLHVTQAGRRRSTKAASQWFSAAARAADISGRTAHGLRRSRMILHAERGATTLQISAWSGHESLKEVERYVRRANRKRALMATDPHEEWIIATVNRVLTTLEIKED